MSTSSSQGGGGNNNSYPFYNSPPPDMLMEMGLDDAGGAAAGGGGGGNFPLMMDNNTMDSIPCASSPSCLYSNDPGNNGTSGGHGGRGSVGGGSACSSSSSTPQNLLHRHQELDDNIQKLLSKSELMDRELNALIEARQQLVIQLNDYHRKRQFLQSATSGGGNNNNITSYPAEELARFAKDLEVQKTLLQQHHSATTSKQQDWLNNLEDFFSRARELESLVVDEELAAWKREQQLHGNGGYFSGETGLNKIQEWCEILTNVILRSYIQLKKFTEQTQMTRSPEDQLYQMVENLRHQAKVFLKEFAQKTFVVEKQPPQVMKTNTRFASTLRLLCGYALNIHKSAPTVKVSIISEATASKFVHNPSENGPCEMSGVIGNGTNNLDFHESTKQMTANFRNMQLSKIRRTEKKGTESVMDEKFALLFECKFQLSDDFCFYIWSLSLPVVVIVHGNQEPHAWATVTWDNAFAALSRKPFMVPDKVPWSRVGEVLSMKFRQYVGKSLAPDALHFLAGKAFRNPNHSGPDYDNILLSWSQFAKETLNERNFTFWEWFYAILKLTREHLRQLWAEQSMIGFISRKQTEDLLLACQLGTFLLRFSDSELGGVTIAWVGESDVGQPEVFMVQPFTSKDFAIRGLADRVNDLKNIQYLYPNIPKDQIFGKFYTRVNDQPSLANGYVKPWLALTLPGTLTDHESNCQLPSPPMNDLNELDELLDQIVDGSNYNI